MSETDMTEIGRRAMQNLLELYVNPEVERRQGAGELPRPLDLRGAQIIFYADGRKPEVRINSEVKALGKMKLKPGVAKERGEPVYEHELEGLDGLTLTEDEDPDCGHATMLRLNGEWMLAFDFIYNKDRIRRHIATAEEFLAAAKYSLNERHWSAYIDNLYSAAELLAKANLVVIFHDPHLTGSHKAIHSRYNRMAHLGNVDPAHAGTLNDLTKLRARARYLKAHISVSEQDATAWLGHVEQMLAEAMDLVARRI